MKNINTFNKAFILFTVIMITTLIILIRKYKGSERFYYTQSASTPAEFPINIQGMWFYLPNDKIGSSFYTSIQKINHNNSYWGDNEDKKEDALQLIPQSLYIEYIDFRTKNYYLDTIALPRQKIIDLFRQAKDKRQLKNYSYDALSNDIAGLEFHVGIANDGNIIFWLLGKDFNTTFHTVKLTPKPFPRHISSYVEPFKIASKEQYLKDIFDDYITDNTQRTWIITPSKAQYKDSIPTFRN